MEPPVSEPRAQIAVLLATAAALPPEEPPGTQSVFQGLVVFAKFFIFFSAIWIF